MKEHFKDYDDIWYRIKELELKKEEIEHKLYDTKALSYGETIHGTAPKDIILDLIAKKDDITHEIKNEMKKLNKLKKAHMKEISHLKDIRYRSIIRSCYLEKLDNNKIADIMNLSIAHYYRLKREAIDEFKEMIVNDSK